MLVDQLRIVGSPQTNKVMHGELSRLAVRALQRRPPEPKKVGTGQLVYPFDAELATVAATYMRTATRVVWDLYRCQAARLEPLYDELRADIAADTRAWLPKPARISVEVRRVADFAAGERQIVGAVKNAIVDALAPRGIQVTVDPDSPDALVVARLDDDGSLVVSLDLGGGSMSQRGWRVRQGPAPLREHLAAVLLMLGRYDPRRDILIDPLCGAGTIVIEATHMSRAEPRLAKKPNVPALASAWPSGEPLFADTVPLILGNDQDLNALFAAKENAVAAGVAGQVTWRKGDFRRIHRNEIEALARERNRVVESGLIIGNPPYGERLDDPELLDLYRDLGEFCRGFPGWRAGFLVANPEFEYAFGGRPRVKKPLSNAGLRAYWYLYEL